MINEQTGFDDFAASVDPENLGEGRVLIPLNMNPGE